jgi:hypothetical protein
MSVTEFLEGIASLQTLGVESGVYFAYGSNMDAHRMAERVGERLPSCRARLAGYELKFNKRTQSGGGAANIVVQPHSQVFGVAYAVLPMDLRTLDRHEGVSSGHYGRRVVKVELWDGASTSASDFYTIEAIVYVACKEYVDNSVLPTKEYMAHLLAGAPMLPLFYVKQLGAHPLLGSR